VSRFLGYLTSKMSKKKEKKRSVSKKPRGVFKESDLHHSLYFAGRRYFENTPWEKLGGQDTFAVRAPGESYPLAASVLGAGGEEYDLSVLRGSSAAGQFKMINTGARCDPSEMDLMYLGLEKYKKIPDELRRFYKRAGIRPEPSALVPMFFIKRPYQVAREPNREEVETLLYLINGVMTAIESGLLREGETITPEGLITLNLSGDPQSPKTEVSGDYTDSKLEKLPTPTLLINRNELKRLPVLNETWVIACRSMPMRVQGIADEMRALITMDERSGMVLDSEIVQGVEAIIQSACHLIDVMLGKKIGAAFKGKKRTGRPRSIIFVDSELYKILGDQLTEVGISCDFVTQIPPMMQEVLDGLTEFLGTKR
jgi:hypothetical protein